MTRPITTLLPTPLAAPPPWMPPTTTTSSGQGTGAVPVVPATQQQPVDLTQITGVVDLRFSYQSLGTSLSEVQMYRPVADGSSTVGAQLQVPLISRGFLAGMTFSGSETHTGGLATFTVYLNDVAGPSIDWLGSGRTEIEKFEPNQYPFTSGTKLDVRVTTNASFAPTTADVEVIVYVIFTAET